MANQCDCVCVRLLSFIAAADNNNPFIKYVLPKSELDIAHKDVDSKTFPANFEVS